MSTAKIAKPPKIIRKSSPTARSRPYCAIFLVLREKVCDIVIASRPYCHPELVEGSRGNETSLYACHFTSFRYREIATLTLAMTTGFCNKPRAERANLYEKTRAERANFATNLSQSRPFATNEKPIRSVLINGLCNFEDGIGAATAATVSSVGLDVKYKRLRHVVA